METLHEAARRLLQELEQRVKRPSGEKPERIKRPEAAPDRQHTSGSPPATWEEFGRDHTAETGRSGLELDAGELGCFEHRIDATMRSPATNADTNRYEFTNTGYSVRVRFAGDARWIDLRAVPRRARLGGGVSLLSSSRLHANDNVRHAGTSARQYSCSEYVGAKPSPATA